jgi:hypothetical protein
LLGCKKSETNGVMIRVENRTRFTLDSVRLAYDITKHNYGQILPGKVTTYIFFEALPNTPAALADSAGKTIFAGLLIAPNSYPTSMLVNGKYTLSIFPDPTLFSHYNANFTRD